MRISIKILSRSRGCGSGRDFGNLLISFGNIVTTQIIFVVFINFCKDCKKAVKLDCMCLGNLFEEKNSKFSIG